MDNTVALLKESVSGLLTGINLTNEVTSLNAGLERALRVMSIKVDIPEAIANESIILYSGVTDYLSPEFIFGTSLVDFRPQGDSRTAGDFVYKKGISFFDRTKHILPSGYALTFESNKGINTVRISQTKTFERIFIDPMSDDDGWVTGGNASGLAEDQTVYYDSPSSLRFNLAAAGSSGYIEKTLDNGLDLSAYEGVGVAFLAVYLPSATAITSITLHLGNDFSNYFSVSATDGFLGTFIAQDWLLVALDLSLASETGTVDMSSVDYVRAIFNYDGTSLPNVRVGGLWLSLPSPHKIYFQTAAVFQAPGSNPSHKITDNTDRILLNDAAYTIYEIESACSLLLGSGAGEGNPLYQQYQRLLHGSGNVNDLGLYAKYEADNPSQEIRSTDNYYL